MKENIVGGFILLLLAGLGKVIYDYRTPIYYFFIRLKLRILPVNFNIALSLSFEEGLNSGEYFKEIKKSLSKEIDKANLSNHIKIKDFSDIQRFSSKSEAEEYRNKKNIDLIIWGDFSSDALKRKGKSISDIHLKFTFGYPEDRENKIGAMLQLDFSSKLAQKNYLP